MPANSSCIQPGRFSWSRVLRTSCTRRTSALLPSGWYQFMANANWRLVPGQNDSCWIRNSIVFDGGLVGAEAR